MTLKKSKNLFLLSIMCWLACVIGYLTSSIYECEVGETISYFHEDIDFSVIGFLGSLGRGALIGLGIMVVIFSFIVQDEGKKPEAIDVYRGDTALQISYTNGIPTDTTVVWKDGRKREW